MDTPGSILKAERLKQKKSLKAIEKKLKIHLDYLKAIESDNYDSLPPEFFSKAYLRLYAEILNLDHDYILRLYKNRIDENAEEKPAPKPPVKKLSLTSFKPMFHRAYSSKTLIGIVVLTIIVLSSFVVIKYTKRESPAQDINKIHAPEVIAEPDKLSLTITATELTWVSVRVDDSKRREWLLRPGEEISLTANDRFAVKVGNAGGTRLILNNEDIGVLGPHGKVADIILP